MTDMRTNQMELRKLRLHAALAEYQALRAEMLQKFRNHLQIYSILIAAVSVMLAWVITKKAFDVFLAIPIVSISLTFRYIWEQNVIIMLGDYLHNMEVSVFPKLLTSEEQIEPERQPFLVWEQYFRNNFPRLPLYKAATLVLMVVIPIMPALVYSILTLSNLRYGFPILEQSQLHFSIHIVGVVLYFPLGIYLTRRLWNS